MFVENDEFTIDTQSPSMRREWIEIPERVSINDIKASPSMRREWIEMNFEKL